MFAILLLLNGTRHRLSRDLCFRRRSLVPSRERECNTPEQGRSGAPRYRYDRSPLEPRTQQFRLRYPRPSIVIVSWKVTSTRLILARGRTAAGDLPVSRECASSPNAETATSLIAGEKLYSPAFRNNSITHTRQIRLTIITRRLRTRIS